jgi:hypothetical protein
MVHSIVIDPGDRPQIVCRKCGATVVWPKDLSPTLAPEFASITRESRLKGAEFAHSRLGLGLREAKALPLHVTEVPGICRRCRSRVPKGESVCTRRSACIDW